MSVDVDGTVSCVKLVVSANNRVGSVMAVYRASGKVKSVLPVTCRCVTAVGALAVMAVASAAAMGSVA